MLFNKKGEVVARAQVEFPRFFLSPAGSNMIRRKSSVAWLQRFPAPSKNRVPKREKSLG
ncbi:MAG: hypothetical protein ABI767_17075 [Rhodanobacter sp.]